ncbi:MAG: hypothetical protein ACHQIK_08770 [Candidatus Acidiferrales bacterium]
MSDNEVPRQLRAIMDVLDLDWASSFKKVTEGCAQNRDKVFAWLYRVLDTLDNKTGQLLRFASLLLAAQTFLAQALVRTAQTTNTPPWISRTALGLLVLPLAAGAFGFNVFRAAWPFFGRVQPTERTETGGQDTEEKIKLEMCDLAEVCDRRYKANKYTYWMCWVSIGAFVLTLVLALMVI